MAVALWVLTGVVVVLIALGAVGAISARLATEVRVAVYDLAEAVEYVAARLPDDATARLAFDDVEAVLLAHLAVLQALGVATEDGGSVDQDGDEVTVDDDEILARVLQQLDAGDAPGALADDDVALVLEVEQQYVRAIGAVGPEAAPAP